MNRAVVGKGMFSKSISLRLREALNTAVSSTTKPTDIVDVGREILALDQQVNDTDPRENSVKLPSREVSGLTLEGSAKASGPDAKSRILEMEADKDGGMYFISTESDTGKSTYRSYSTSPSSQGTTAVAYQQDGTTDAPILVELRSKLDRETNLLYKVDQESSSRERTERAVISHLYEPHSEIQRFAQHRRDELQPIVQRARQAAQGGVRENRQLRTVPVQMNLNSAELPGDSLFQGTYDRDGGVINLVNKQNSSVQVSYRGERGERMETTIVRGDTGVATSFYQEELEKGTFYYYSESAPLS